MARGVSYSDAQVLRGLKTHIVTNKLSKFTMHKPMTWQGIVKRMKNDEEFADKVQHIVNEAEAVWEKMGIEALESGDETFNVTLFKMYAGTKRAFQSYETNELEERIERLENDH